MCVFFILCVCMSGCTAADSNAIGTSNLKGNGRPHVGHAGRAHGPGGPGRWVTEKKLYGSCMHGVAVHISGRWLTRVSGHDPTLHREVLRCSGSWFADKKIRMGDLAAADDALTSRASVPDSNHGQSRYGERHASVIDLMYAGRRWYIHDPYNFFAMSSRLATMFTIFQF